jgi:hypothetical protein
MPGVRLKIDDLANLLKPSGAGSNHASGANSELQNGPAPPNRGASRIGARLAL